MLQINIMLKDKIDNTISVDHAYNMTLGEPPVPLSWCYPGFLINYDLGGN